MKNHRFRLPMVASALLLVIQLLASAGAQTAINSAITPVPVIPICDPSPNLIHRITQSQVTSGQLTLFDLRKEGFRIFTTPFNKGDGFGESYDVNNPDHTSFGNRPTLQDNGTFLRVNGLDAQSCLECHGVVSNASIPAVLGVGGVGGISTSPLAGPQNIDVDDSANNGFAFFDGRLINPPFIFGAAGVEALGKEMTTALQNLKLQAMLNPGIPVSLVTKGVNFGVIVYNASTGLFDTSGVVGIDEDLVVRPFSRKGVNHTTRDFDRGATQFHSGMEAVEVLIAQGLPGNTDGDGDGVVNELLIGEMSVLHIFSNLQPQPFIGPSPSPDGYNTFVSTGCAECHIPVLTTDSYNHNFSYPDEPTAPLNNIYLTVDLRTPPMSFQQVGNGVAVALFADLKRHDMGPGLMESTGGLLDREFTTARLWGIADTAPYLHDGRAFTLCEAILAHGGEAQNARNAFVGLSNSARNALLDFLRTLRTPLNPNQGFGPPIPNVNN